MTLQRNIPFKDLRFGSHKRQDGHIFEITARLYEMPAEYNYWQAPYDAYHKEWGHMRFVLTIPKKIASTLELAEALMGGDPLQAVKILLQAATEDGRTFYIHVSPDGWSLV